MFHKKDIEMEFAKVVRLMHYLETTDTQEQSEKSYWLEAFRICDYLPYIASMSYNGFSATHILYCDSDVVIYQYIYFSSELGRMCGHKPQISRLRVTNTFGDDENLEDFHTAYEQPLEQLEDRKSELFDELLEHYTNPTKEEY